MTHHEALGKWETAQEWSLFPREILTEIQVQLSPEQNFFFSRLLVRLWINYAGNPGPFHLFAFWHPPGTGLLRVAQSSWLTSFYTSRTNQRKEKGREGMHLLSQNITCNEVSILHDYITIKKERKMSDIEELTDASHIQSFCSGWSHRKVNW